MSGAWAHKDSVLAGEGLRDLAVQEHVRSYRRDNEDPQQQHGATKMSEEQATTLLIKKVPRKYTEETLLQELEPYVGPGSYNFLFLPWDGRRSANLGSAFLNCVDAPTARRLRERLDGKPWLFAEQPREIKVLSAHVQGIARNLIQHLGSFVVEPGYSHPPMVFHSGQRISYERAVDIYCPPDLVRGHSRDKSMAQDDVAARPSGRARAAQTPTRSSGETRGSTGSGLGVLGAAAEARAPRARAAARPPSSSPAGCLAPEELGWQPAIRSTNSVYSILEGDGSEEPGSSESTEQPQDTRSSDSAQVLASHAYITAWKQINKQLRALEAAHGMGTEFPIHLSRFSC